MYTIDLDAAPKERFKEPARDFREEIKVLYKVYEFHYTFTFRLIFKTLSWIVSNFHTEYLEEMEGIAEELNFNYHRVVILNYFLELASFCTSIVARTTEG